MPSSPNKGYTQPASGAAAWGVDLNANMIEFVDLNLGGVYSLNVSAGGTFTLTASQSRNSTLVLTGNPASTVTVNTYPGGSPIYGFLFVDNQCSTNTEIRIANLAQPALYAVVPAKTRVTVISDATYGVRIAGQNGFASGVSLLFVQAAAPTGWTKSTANDNKALRVTSGAGGGTGGTGGNFTSVFSARTIAQANLPNLSFTSSANGNHNHGSLTGTGPKCYSGGGSSSTVTVTGLGSNLYHEGGGHTSSSTTTFGRNGPVSIPNSGTHTHTVSLGGSGTALDFAVQYIDTIICTKD